MVNSIENQSEKDKGWYENYEEIHLYNLWLCLR